MTPNGHQQSIGQAHRMTDILRIAEALRQAHVGQTMALEAGGGAMWAHAAMQSGVERLPTDMERRAIVELLEPK